MRNFGTDLIPFSLSTEISKGCSCNEKMSHYSDCSDKMATLGSFKWRRIKPDGRQGCKCMAALVCVLRPKKEGAVWVRPVPARDVGERAGVAGRSRSAGSRRVDEKVRPLCRPGCGGKAAEEAEKLLPPKRPGDRLRPPVDSENRDSEPGLGCAAEGENQRQGGAVKRRWKSGRKAARTRLA